MAKSVVKKYGWGGARPGQTGRKRILTVFQRRDVGQECESRWTVLRLQADPGGSIMVNAEGETSSYQGTRPYGERSRLLDAVVAWCAAERGITISRRMVERCWAEFRASEAAARKAAPQQDDRAA